MRYFYGLGIRLKFITPLKDVTAKERESAEFTVELSHDNIPVIWYKNDQRLHTSKVVSMKDDGKFHTLTFKDLTIDDTSQIRVEAMDKSSEAKLTVLGMCDLTLVCLILLRKSCSRLGRGYIWVGSSLSRELSTSCLSRSIVFCCQSVSSFRKFFYRFSTPNCCTLLFGSGELLIFYFLFLCFVILLCRCILIRNCL